MEHLHVASQRSRLTIAVSTVVALIAALILVVSPSRSLAAGTGDQIYWGNEDSGVWSGSLDNPGAAAIVRSGTPCGVALDPADGKIYWANWSGGIKVANLDGTETVSTLFPEGGHNLCGVAVDPTNNKIYWADFTADTIRVGNLDGSDSPRTLFSEPTQPTQPHPAPSGVAIDPVAGKIYWTNQFTDQVRFGNLDGSGSASTLFGSDAPVPTVERNPIGVAIDPDAGKIYWTNLGNCCSGPGQVRVGNLNGTVSEDSPKTLFSNESGPGGLAIDPAAGPAGKIYWATFGPGVIRSGNLDGSPGTTSTLFSGQSQSLFAAILKAPAGTGAPIVSSTGGTLNCGKGSWAPDLLGAFLYRAPENFAYQWLLDGDEIPGETASITPTEPGAYTCEVTASNHAGSTSQTSAAFTISDVTDLKDAHVWVGLKNSDDQGTRFDVRVQLLENGSPVATGVTRCVIGVTRNANQATDVIVPWSAFGGVRLYPDDVLALKVSTRIGTNANDAKCGGHNNAVGLRLYYDSTTRASRFGATITPNPSANEYLHSNGGACTSTESAGVTTRYFDVAQSSTTAKCKDSSSINFSGGNPWAEIGTWTWSRPQA